MSKPKISYWPALSATTQAVASAQSYTAGIPLLLKTNTGGYSNPPASVWANPTVPTPAPNVAGFLNAFVINADANLTAQNNPSDNGPYYMPGIIRTLNFASSGDLSGTTFTVVGWGFPASYITATGSPASFPNPIVVPNVALISEQVTGPNGPIVETVNAYSQIISITPNVSENASTVTVGHGPHGITNFHNMDTDLIDWTAQLQIFQIKPSGPPQDMNSGAYISLFDPSFPNPKSGNLNFHSDGLLCITGLTYNTSATKNSSIAAPFRTAFGLFLDAPSSTTSAYFISIQQGLRS